MELARATVGLWLLALLELAIVQHLRQKRQQQVPVSTTVAILILESARELIKFCRRVAGRVGGGIFFLLLLLLLASGQCSVSTQQRRTGCRGRIPAIGKPPSSLPASALARVALTQPLASLEPLGWREAKDAANAAHRPVVSRWSFVVGGGGTSCCVLHSPLPRSRRIHSV